MNQPNIIFIMADDMGYGDVACNGDGRIPTPHMDRLAAEGCRFTDAHASSSVCTPSRYSVLTGRYNWRSHQKWGVISGFTPALIDPARETVASLLKQQGYATAAVGKWHLGLDWQEKPFIDLRGAERPMDAVDFSRPVSRGPCDLGFDRFFGIAGSLNMAPYCFIDGRHSVGIPSVPHPGSDCPIENSQPGLMVEDWSDEEIDLRMADRALAFVEDHIRERPAEPFFLYWTPSAPHAPWKPPAFAQGASGIGPRGDLVAVVDHLVGRMLDLLDERGIAENTLIIVTSDNGAHDVSAAEAEAHGHHSNGEFRGYKSQIFDGGHREPFLVRWPEVVPAGTRCDQMVSLMDLMATCADLTDAELSDRMAEDSVSFLPLLRDPEGAGPVREELVHHSARARFALRCGDWKLIESLDSGGFTEPGWTQPEPGGPEGMLFRMDRDWREQEDRWLREPDRVKDLRRRLRAVQEGR